MTTRTIPVIPTEKLIKLEGRTKVINDIHQERSRQEYLHPEEYSLPNLFIALGEEFGEVAEALQANLRLPGVKATDKQDLYKELIEVAAVAVRMAEQAIPDEKEKNI